MRVMRMLVVVVAALFGGASGASAAVPVATGYVECATSGGPVDDPHSCSNGSNDAATRVLSPDATLTATSNYPGGFLNTLASASSFLTYYFAITGGSYGDTVPIEVDFNLAATATGTGYGSAYFSVTGFANKGICTRSDCADQSQSYTGAFHINGSVGYTYEIYTFAQAGTPYGAGSGTGYGMVDPYIHVGSDYAGRYGIEVSEGVGNVAPTVPGVPEPATWALLVPAFGLIGGVLRRRPVRAAAC